MKKAMTVLAVFLLLFTAALQHVYAGEPDATSRLVLAATTTSTTATTKATTTTSASDEDENESTDSSNMIPLIFLGVLAVGGLAGFLIVRVTKGKKKPAAGGAPAGMHPYGNLNGNSSVQPFRGGSPNGAIQPTGMDQSPAEATQYFPSGSAYNAYDRQAGTNGAAYAQQSPGTGYGSSASLFAQQSSVPSPGAGYSGETVSLPSQPSPVPSQPSPVPSRPAPVPSPVADFGETVALPAQPAPMPQPAPAPKPAPVPQEPIRMVGKGGFFDNRKFVQQGDTLIGRHPQRCAICYPIDEKGISTIHCLVTRTPAGIEIKDLDSSYGTFVNGTKLTPNVPAVLHRGDTFWLADVTNSFYVVG